MPEMTDEEHKEFMDAQIKKIEVDKWLEGERIGRDPGDEYVKNGYVRKPPNSVKNGLRKKSIPI